MSQTVPVDVVGRTYWAYVASAMAEGLGQMLQHGAEGSVIPRRVYTDAQEFFRLALEAAGDAVPSNPSASIANYLIAAGAMPAQKEPVDRPALETFLKEYAQFLQRLQLGKPLRSDDSKVAHELQQFFVQVQEEAEAEAYDKIVQFEPPRTGLRIG